MSLRKTHEECKGCAWCCEYSGLPLKQPVSAKTIEFYGKRAKEIRKLDGYLFVILYSPCPRLKDGLCDCYEERPRICKEYPNGRMKGLEHYCALYRKYKKEKEYGKL